MATVRELKSIDQIEEEDLLALYRTINRDPRRVTVATILQFISDNIQFPSVEMVRQEETGTSIPYTVNVVDVGKSVILFVNYAYANSLTIVLPENPVDGQEIWMRFDHDIGRPVFDANGHSTFWTNYTYIEDLGYDKWFIIKFAEQLDMWYPLTHYDPTDPG